MLMDSGDGWLYNNLTWFLLLRKKLQWFCMWMDENEKLDKYFATEQECNQKNKFEETKTFFRESNF